MKKAFTLVELLVVVAIIGLLASILLVAFSGVSAKGRDARREVEITSISKALEMYFSENTGYPEITSWVSIEEDATFSTEMAEYLPTMPNDPLYGETSEEGEPYSYQYISSSGGEHYAVKVTYEAKGPDGIEETIIAYSSPEGEIALGGGGASSLSEAMDYHPELIDNWGLITGGSSGWTVDVGAGFLNGSAAKSGNIANGETTYIEIVNPDGLGTYGVDFRAEGGLNDIITVTMRTFDGSFLGSMTQSGTPSSGSFGNSAVPAGGSIRFEYTRAASGSFGENAMWLDNFNWSPH